MMKWNWRKKRQRVLSFTFIRVDDTAESVESNEGRRKHPVDLRFRFISNGKPPLLLRAQDCRRRLSAVVDDFDFRKLPSDVRLLPVNPRCYFIFYGDDDDSCLFYLLYRKKRKVHE